MTDRPAIQFPDGFIWGSATASYQIEGGAFSGGRGPSVWDTFSHTEGKVANGHNGDVACDHFNRMRSDVAMMKELGHQTYRFSISWSRVQPEGRGKVNREGIAFYQQLVDELLTNDIVPCPTLFHWDLPQGLEDLGGFRNRDTVGWFGDYAAVMAKELGDRVTMWSTFNEPWCYAYLGHGAGVHAPGLRDGMAAVTVAHHELLAHGTALQAMRAERNGLGLGIVINPTNVRSEGSPAASSDAIRRVDAIHNRWWFDAPLKGHYPADIIDDFGEAYGPLDHIIQDGDNATIAQPLDWIGINYYFDQLLKGAGADASKRMGAYPTVTGTTEADQRSVHTDMGWPITPEGFTELLLRLHDDYPNLPPVYITENGCAYDDPVIDGKVADTRRIKYLDAHLQALHAAIEAGVDVRGYYQWSLMDNFEWALGFDKRFGLVHVDFDTLDRTPRDSAYWYREVIKANGLPAKG
ncbi:MAG TPA: GH1 family beta-glucosidase [Ilumatobacter sp.]|nr:GH1 family beta-glucosidase [Ilumatobacter sp.]